MFCKRCHEVLSIRPPRPVSETEDFRCFSATTLNGSVKKLLYGYKFHDRQDAEPELAGLMINHWQHLSGMLGLESLHPENILVVPIPPHEDQPSKVEGFASRFARYFGYDYRASTLAWVREVKPQHTILDRRGRSANIAGGLRLRLSLDRDHARIVIIDDLITTGATLREAYRALREGDHAKSHRDIIGLSVSRVPLAFPVEEPSMLRSG